MKTPFVPSLISLLAAANSLSPASAQTQPAQMAPGQNATAQVWGIALKPDPPPAVDGRVEEWSKVPSVRVLDTREHVTYGNHKWLSANDLSARVWLAWREEGLYLAAQVKDDKVVQKGHGTDIWKGDHLELYLDFAPETDTARTAVGAGQLHLGLSPGNFQKTGNAVNDTAPELVVFQPRSTNLDDVEGSKETRIAALRTEDGYDLEALLPWRLLANLSGQAFSGAPAGQPFSVEIGISDSDSPEPIQEKMMTLGTGTWDQNRANWQSALLAPADGVAPPLPARRFDIFPATEVAANTKREIKFQSAGIPAGRRAVLVFRSRIQMEATGGYTQGMGLSLNGVLLTGAQLLNRKAGESMNDGRAFTPFGSDRFTLPYSKSFESADSDLAYGLRSSQASLFEIDITDSLREGDNSLTFDFELPGEPRVMQVGAGALEFRLPVVPVVKRAAPTGSIPTFAPNANHKVNYRGSQASDSALDVQVGKSKFQIQSQFSTPDGKWTEGSNAYFRHSRAVEKRGEAIIVRDTFTNLTNQNLPLMHQHNARSQEGDWKSVWLAGLKPNSRIGVSNDPGNPSSFATSDSAGLGLLPLDDVFQVHTNNSSDGKHLGLSDSNLVLKPGSTYVAEWAILPTDKPDYYTFVNAARRLRDVNFAIDGSFTFYFPSPERPTSTWSDEQWVNFFKFKNAKYPSHSLSWPRLNGLVPHGTAVFQVDWSYNQREIARLKKLLPGYKFNSYFHCFIDSSPDADKRFPEARLLRSDGTQADYGLPGYKIFVPTTTNSYGREMQRYVDFIFAPSPQGLNNDGIYWDEVEYSAARYHYDDFSAPKSGLPWDGFSADIDPKTKTIIRLKSSVTLISQDIRVALARRIMARGFLIGNGAPYTRSMMQMHFPRFAETGSISNCTQTHLFTPIALGDHLSEKNELDSYRVMLRALDYGCVYYWYSDDVVPTHPTLTSYMFPITPLELHEGFIIGKERIVTNRSGLFGWGDNSKHEVHVFNEQGKEVKDFKAPLVVKNSKTYTELRLAEDWSAAIIRK